MPKNRRDKHLAYRYLTLAKKGQMPDRRTRLGSAIACIERKIIEHFGELNHLQQIQLFNLLPLMCFLIQHPMTIDGTNTIATDWKWCWSRVENGLKVLCDLADKQVKKAPTVFEILEAESNEES